MLARRLQSYSHVKQRLVQYKDTSVIKSIFTFLILSIICVMGAPEMITNNGQPEGSIQVNLRSWVLNSHITHMDCFIGWPTSLNYTDILFLFDQFNNSWIVLSGPIAHSFDLYRSTFLYIPACSFL